MTRLTTEVKLVLMRIEAGLYLQKLRKNNNLSLVDVTTPLNISINYLSEIERGIKIPSDNLIRQLSDYYKIDESDLFVRFGKIPLIAREQLDLSPTLQLTLSEIGKNKQLTDDEKETLYKQLYKSYHQLIEEKSNNI